MALVASKFAADLAAAVGTQADDAEGQAVWVRVANVIDAYIRSGTVSVTVTGTAATTPGPVPVTGTGTGTIT